MGYILKMLGHHELPRQLQCINGINSPSLCNSTDWINNIVPLDNTPFSADCGEQQSKIGVYSDGELETMRPGLYDSHHFHT